MPQPPRTSGYDLITDAGAAVADPNNKWRDEYRLMVERREAERVANERRQKDLDAYLKDYADDPWSQTLAKHQFEREERAKQQKRQAEAREQERQKIIDEYPDDPVMQSWALWKNDSEKRKNLPQKQAAAKAEMLEKIAERDATARKLDRVGGLGMGVADAFVRESVGAAVGVVPGMAAIPARAGEAMGMVEPGTTAELHHQAGDFADSQEQAREDDISPWLSRMYGGAAQSFLQAFGTPGGGYSKAIGFGLTTGNEALTTAEDLGMSDAQKWRYAGTQGVIEAGIAMLGQRLLGPGFEARLAGQQVAASTWKTLAKEIGKDALKEIPEEVVTSILQDVSNKMEGVTPDIGFDEFVTHASEAAVQAAMMAGMGGAFQAPGLALRGETAEDPVEAFRQNPSRKKYKAALKAGLPPVIDPESGEDLGESIEGRQQYAEELTRQQEAQRQLQADAISDELQAAMQTEGRILTDEEMGMEPEAQAPETVSEGDPFFDEVMGYAKDVLNQETTDEGQGQGQQLQDEQQGQGQQPLEGQRPDEGQGEQEGVLTEAAPIPQLSQDVEKAAMKIGGEPNVRVRLSELRKQLGDSVGHQELTDHLMEMERRGEIALYPLENPLERTQEDDQAAALSPVGSPSHVLYFIRQKPDLPWEGPGIEPQAQPSKLAGIDVRMREMAGGAGFEGMRYELYEASGDGDNRGVVRVIDTDAGQTVSITKYPSVEQAQAEWQKAVSIFEEPQASPSVVEETSPAQPKPESAALGTTPDSPLATGEPSPGQSSGKVADPVVSEAEPQGDTDRIWSEDELNNLTPRQRVRDIAKSYGIENSDTRRYNTLIREILQKQPKAEAKPKPKPKKPRPKTPAQERNLRSIVLSYGGINFGTKDYNSAELKSDGLLTVMRKSGQALDAIAQELVTDGHLRVPENQNPADYLVEQLKADADSAKAVYTDAEIKAELEAEQQAYAELQGIKDAGIDEDGIAKIRELSEEAGIRAADEGNPSGELTEAEAEGFVDTSFDFGANVTRTGDPEQSAELHDQLLESIREDMRQSGSVMTLISKIRALPQYEGLSKEDFDAAMVDLHKQQVLELSRHDAPFSLKEPARSQQLVKRGDEYYNAVALRRGVPLNPPAEQEAAGAESPVKAALRKKMAELQAEKEAEASTKPKRKRAPRKKQKPAEVVARDDDAEWWDNELTAVGRRNFLRAAGLQLPDKVMWKNIKEPAKDKLRAQRAGAIDVIESPGAKTPKSARKTAAEKRTEAARARKAAAAEAIRKKLQVDLPSQTNINPLDPEWVTLVAEYAMASMDLGISKFREFVIDFRDTFGEDVTLALSDSVEGSWEILSETNDIGPVGSVAEIIAERRATDATVDAGTGEGDQAEGETVGGDGEQSAGGTGDQVLEGAPAADDQEAAVTGDTGGLREGAARQDVRRDDAAGDGTVAESERGGTGSGRAPADDAGRGRGTGRDVAPPATRPNYHMTNPDAIIGGGKVDKFNRNQRAIEIVRTLEETSRQPTSEELDTLAGYIGWGAFGQELFNGTWENPKPKEGWEEQDQWLRAYLGKDEWKSAQDSIINAHFTEPKTVTAIWGALQKMGFKGGRVLEPSMGVGNFFSLMPRDMMDRSTLTGIEMDKITAKIGAILHPQANVQQKGYQKSLSPDNFYDAIVGNVPFDDKQKIGDIRYKQDFNLHNYFFKKAFDQLKPGGVLAFVTSKGTMDGTTQAKLLRAQIQRDGGELVAALRLPEGAFQQYAGTKVIADLIIIRKIKPGETAQQSGKWTDVVEVEVPDSNGRMHKVKMNEYFAEKPQQVLGNQIYGSGMYGPGLVVKPTGNLDSELNAAMDRLPSEIINTERAPTQHLERPNTTAMRQNSVIAQDKELWIVKGEQLIPLITETAWYRSNSKPRTIEKNRKQIESLLNVREAMREVLAKQGASEDATEARAELNRTYDEFVAEYGPVTKSQALKKLWAANDPMANALSALEKVSGLIRKKYEKRAIFTRPTVRQQRVLDNPTLNDAFVLERNRSLDLDMERIASAAKMPVEQAIEQLEAEGKIYKTGHGTYDAADVFLSGNMARKLRQLQAAQAEGMEGLERSIEAVEMRIPTPIPYSQIEAKLGATWIEASDYAQFIAELLNEDAADVTVERRISGWKVTLPPAFNAKIEATSMHGHPGVSFSKLVTAAMNNASVKVTMPDPENPGSRVTDPEGTAAANAKIGVLRDNFPNFIWSDPDRITRLSAVYNEEFNSTITPEFDEVPLTFEGLALERGDKEFNLRQHQAAAIWRGIVSGKGIFAHEVGTGKTLTMAGLAMESRRLRLAEKPLLLAHNANSLAVRNEIQEAYPGANILYVDNLDAATKDQTLQAIATEEWDLVVVPHSMSERFQLRPETVEELLRPEMEALEAAAVEAFEESDATDFAKGQMPTDLDNISEEEMQALREPTAKELVKERLKLRAQIDKAQQAAASGTGIFFEDMGIDMVMVDEAHIYKKLPITTKQKIKGLNIRASKKGTMLMLLADYIRGQNSGRGVYLFTGTPITNTINEVFNMMRFVMAEEMDAANVRNWDAWFNNFAQEEKLTELSSGGTWENFDRLSSFVNLPELRQMVGQYMDIVFADDMPEFQPRKEREGRSEIPQGRPYKQINNEVIEMLPEQRTKSEELRARYARYRDATGRDKRAMMLEPGAPNTPLVIEGEGVKLALDPRLAEIGTRVEGRTLVTDEAVFDRKNPALKINRMVSNAMTHYNEHPKSTQMIFLQVGYSDNAKRIIGRTEAGDKITAVVPTFNLAKEIKRRLIEEGVKENEIAVFNSMSKEARANAAQKMQEGLIRFAIGNTETMGTGVNAQNELIALHHLDAPWMPGDLEQRNGRGHRQGNKWNTVQEYRYLTEGPQDGRRWQVLLTKDRFIKEFMRGDASKRVIEMDDVDMSDSGGSGSDMEQTFSAAAGDPRIMQRIRLEGQVERLERLRDNHARTVTEVVAKANRKLAAFQRTEDAITTLTNLHETWLQNRTETPEVTIRGKTYVGAKAIKDELDAIAERYRNAVHPPFELGTYRGIPMTVNNGVLYLGEPNQQFADSMTTVTAHFSLTSLQGIMANLPDRVNRIREGMAKDKKFVETAKQASKTPWPKQQQLDGKKKQLEAIKAEMAANPDGSPQWLRAGAPVGTSVYWKGTEYTVAGHRGDDTLLYSDGDTFKPIPAIDATDKDGTKLFPDMKPKAVVEVTQKQMPPGYELVRPGAKSEIVTNLGMESTVATQFFIIAPGGFSVGRGDTAMDAYRQAQTERPDVFLPLQPTKLEEAKEERRRLQELKAQHDKVILREWKRVTQGGVPASGIPITEEMARALVGRMVVSVRSGVKSFEIMVRELRDQFPEDMIRSLAPAMIRGWNSARVKMGLEDEATQATIDMVLAEKKDADIEEMVDAAKGEPVEPEPTEQATEPEVEPAEPEAEPAEEPTDPEDRRQYSTKNAFSAAAREYLGMDERAPVDTLPREASIQLAAAVGSTEAGRERINGLIQSLMIEPQAVTPFENDLLNYRNAELGEKHRAALLRQIDAASRGDDAEEAAATADAAAYASQRRVLIEKVLEPIGTEAGRDLQARQAAINEDYSLERSAMMFEAAYKRKPTSEELAKMQEQVNALKEAEAALRADLAATRDQVEDLQKQLAEAHTKATEDVGRPAEPAAETEPEPPSPGVMKKVRERALKDIAEGVDRFKELLKGNKKFSVGGVLDEVAKASLQIAKGFAELGVVKLSDFLVRAERRIGKEAQKYRPQLIEAWKKVRGDAQAAEQRHITGNLDENDPDSVGRVARDLHRFVIERDGLTASAEDRGKAVEAVHEILSTFIDGITIDQVQRAMSGIGIYRPLSQDEIEVVRRDQKAQLLLLEQIRDWERKQPPPKTGPERPPVSQEQRELRRAVNEAKKAAGIVESTQGQLQSAIDAAKRAASNRIADLTKALRKNERIPANRKVLQDDGSEAFAELRDLRKQRDDLQKLYDETFGPVELTEEQRLDRIEKTLDRAIANLQSDLKTGRLYRDKTAPELTSPAIEAKRAELEALRAVRDEMRLQSGEAQARSDAAYERLLKERDARLAKQIAEKDFSPPPKRKERAYTRKQMAMRLEIEKKKQVIRRERKDWEFKNSHPIYKTFVWGPVAGTAIVRKMLTTIDQSYIGRQGYLLGITHPFLYAKSARKAFASNPFKAWSMFPTEQDLFNTVAALDDDAEWVRLEKIAKVAVTDTHGGLNREEDSQFAPEWVNKIPGVGGSERAVSAFINTQRRLVFRSLVDKLAKRREEGTKGLTDAELRVIGNLVNVASGRGNLAGAQQWESALTAAAAVFFSPRWWVSRIQWWTGQPMWSNSRWLGGEGVSWDVRRMVVMEWGKQLAAQAMIMSIAIGGLTAAFGEPGEDEWWDWYGNPLSPNFGRLRLSETVIDMTAGLGQHLSYLARIFTGRQKNRWEETEIDSLRTLMKYGRGKLAPLPSTIGDYLAGQSLGREKFGSTGYILDSTIPLAMQDLYDAAAKEGMPLAPVISSLMFFGVGAQVYDPRVTSRKDVVNELRAAKKQNRTDDYVQDMLDEHLKESAMYEAKTRLRTADPNDPERIATLERIAAGQDSPELDAAMEKERQDVVLMAAQNLPEEGTRVKSVTAARDLLKAIAPTYQDARELYTQAYRNRYGPTFEVVGNQFRVKKNVRAARRRLLQMYPKE
jgi:N12 class adenine-specific DNA methylase